MAKIGGYVLGLTVALVACDDAGEHPNMTAPPASFEAAATRLLRPVIGGPSVLVETKVETQQAATGGRASGHSELGPLAFPPSERRDKMSFIALSTDQFPYAKGEMEWRSGYPAGQRNFFHAHVNVECLSITGNQAWLSGTGTFEREGRSEGTFFFQWSVQDNGEGSSSPPDMTSQLFFADSPQDCHLRLEPPIFELEGGDIQVEEQ